jgi:acid phosphatase
MTAPWGGQRRPPHRKPLLDRLFGEGRWRPIAIGVAALLTIVAVSFSATRPGAHAGPPASASPSASRSATALLSPPPGPSAAVPRFKHVWLIVLENKTYDQIVGAKTAPFLNQLIATSGLATKYQAVTHPSLPNYLALFSGSTHGVSDDKPHDITAPTLADQLEGAGKTWRVYAENVPTGCDTSATAHDGPDGSGTYARKHEPAISFTSISGNPARCANVVPFKGFDPAAANVELIVPNLCNDMHDCSVAVGDAWLRGFLPTITGSAAYRDNGVVVLTFDEGADGTNPPNRVATIISSPLVAPGTRSSVPHTHYSLLRTIQDGFGLDCLAESCSANTLGEFFSGAAPSPSG